MRSRRTWLDPVLALLVVASLTYLFWQPSEPSPARPSPTASAISSAPPMGPREQYAGCCRNLETMMSELRRTYGEGPVPMASLQAMSFAYRCPAARKPTYSATGDGTMGDLTLFCRGSYHLAAGVPENFPDLHSQRGLNRGFDPRDKLGIPAPSPRP